MGADCRESVQGLAGQVGKVSASKEDAGNIAYLTDCAQQAGLATVFMDITEIGLRGAQFVDLGNQPINLLFKLYP